MDWKRLKTGDLKHLPSQNRYFKIFTKRNEVLNVIKNWDTSELSRLNLSNMQTRLVFKSKMGLDNQFQTFSKADQIKIAKEALQEYDLIGITEKFNDSINQLCHKNEWCPPKNLVKLNSSHQQKKYNKKTIDAIKDINEQDIELYDEAIRINALYQKVDDYTVEIFEKKFAAKRTQILSPIFKENTYLYDFNMPIIGNGVHFRDAANTKECAVWTGPSTSTSLFFPVVAQSDINILLYIKGYSDDSIKSSIKIEINGQIYPHKFHDHEWLDSVLICRHVTVRNFVHVKIHIDKVYSSTDDKRLRGISLFKYGFSCNF